MQQRLEAQSGRRRRQHQRRRQRCRQLPYRPSSHRSVLPSHAGPATLLEPESTRGSAAQQPGDTGDQDVGTSATRLVDKGAATPPTQAEQPPLQLQQHQEQQHQYQQPPATSLAGGGTALLKKGNGQCSVEAEVAATLRALPDLTQAGALLSPQPATVRCCPTLHEHQRPLLPPLPPLNSRQCALPRPALQRRRQAAAMPR
jgi:hypothetical protein